MVEAAVLKAAEVLWDYHCVERDPTSAVDFILAMGSQDVRVAESAARSWLDRTAPNLLVSGGSGKVTGGLWSKPEAEVFADIAMEMGVPRSALLVETRATNSGENVLLSKKLLSNEGVEVSTGVLVTKPYMRRRALATAEKQWAELEWFVSSPSVKFRDYPTRDIPIERMINLMVGDLQRLEVYADQGFQVPQEIPVQVWTAWHELVRSGFDQFVIKPT